MKLSAAMSLCGSFTSPTSKNTRARTDDGFRLDIQYAEMSLRAATAAVDATGKQVKVETEVLWGTVKTSLIDDGSNHEHPTS
jgi:hypothetical protein